MASSVSVRDKLVASYYQACSPRVPKYDSDVAKVSLVADIYNLLEYSDTKTRIAAESILRNKLLTLPQKLSTLRVIARSSAQKVFVPELRHLLSINARRVREQREKQELRQRAAHNANEIGRTPHSPTPSARAVAHTEVREEKRAPSAASAQSPSATLQAEPTQIESSLPAPETASIRRASTSSNPASDNDADTLIRFFASMIFAAMVAYQASK